MGRETARAAAMKALTLWMPHALLIPFRWKEVETRDWYTGYRGPLAIHAAKLFNPTIALDVARIDELTRDYLFATPEMVAWPASVRDSLGCIVATCTLAGCVPTSFAIESSAKLKPPFGPKLGWEVEAIMGDYSPGRWAWILRDVVPVIPPIAATGHQKLWEWRRAGAPDGCVCKVPGDATNGCRQHPFAL